MTDSGMSAMTERGALDLAIATLQQRVKDRDAEIERLRAGIQNFINGDYEPRIKKIEKCKHGLYGYEDCGSCASEHFEQLLKAQ